MSSTGQHEIIIIKRGSEEEEGHHGGAWKIAFADFMTAMMALFLVLWLINAANEETKRAVASYFNPIRLVDRNRSVKGVDEQKGGPSENDETGGAAVPHEQISDDILTTRSLAPREAASKAHIGMSDKETFFEDPMAALERIEANILARQVAAAETEGIEGKAKPQSFTDPFDPKTIEPHPVSTPDQGDMEKADGTAVEPHRKPGTAGPETQPQEPQGTALKEQALQADAAELERTIQDEVAGKLGSDNAASGSITATATDKGILIRISDTPTTPMFGIGEAVPTGETVVAVNAVARALATREGPVHIFGHTDARKYAGAGNGNWRLSLERAQSIYFILLRGGLSDDRIAEVSGFADRKPLDKAEPMADQNRRIEILLEKT